MMALAFSTRNINPSLAKTLVVLIPKVNSPNSLKDFHPISMCSVLLKAISKVMVHRVRPFLNSTIGPYQNSFILGRGTTDNALIA